VKLLLDSCVWGGARADLQTRGHDVVWCGDLEADPGDEAVLEAARVEGRILVTLDKDFGELAIVRGLPHCGILRLVGFGAREQGAACARVLALRGADLAAGAIATASPGQLRIRSPNVTSNRDDEGA
jgi:predicted nuclease of predicted toxin-antitoxin system